MDFTSVVSGEVLFNAKNRTQVLPSWGEKLSENCGSLMEERQVQERLQHRNSIISELRVSRKDQLATGQWINESKMVRLIQQTGTFWDHMGVETDIGRCLYPEESIFLIEMGELEVDHGGIPLSLQSAQAVMLEDSCQLDQYLVYAHLTRSGCKVVRHQPHLRFTRYEKQIRIDQHQAKRKKKKLKLKCEDSEIQEVQAKSAAKEINKSANPSKENEMKIIEDHRSMDDALKEFYSSLGEEANSHDKNLKQTDTFEIHQNLDERNGEGSHAETKDDVCLDIFEKKKKEYLNLFPSMLGKTVQVVDVEKPELLPENSVPNKTQYEINLDFLNYYCRYVDDNSNSFPQYHSNMRFRGGRGNFRGNANGDHYKYQSFGHRKGFDGGDRTWERGTHDNRFEGPSRRERNDDRSDGHFWRERDERNDDRFEGRSWRERDERNDDRFEGPSWREKDERMYKYSVNEVSSDKWSDVNTKSSFDYASEGGKIWEKQYGDDNRYSNQRHLRKRRLNNDKNGTEASWNIGRTFTDDSQYSRMCNPSRSVGNTYAQRSTKVLVNSDDYIKQTFWNSEGERAEGRSNRRTCESDCSGMKNFEESYLGFNVNDSHSNEVTGHNDTRTRKISEWYQHDDRTSLSSYDETSSSNVTERPSLDLSVVPPWKNKRRVRRRNNRPDTYPSYLIKLPVPVHSWKEYKSFVKSMSEDNLLMQGCGKALWSGRSTPLIKPAMATSLQNVLEKCCIFSETKEVPSRQQNIPEELHLTLHFDVYLPNAPYRKSCPPIPNKRVTVIRNGIVPSFGQIQEVTRRFLDEAPVVSAVVLAGEVRLYTLSPCILHPPTST